LSTPSQPLGKADSTGVMVSRDPSFPVHYRGQVRSVTYEPKGARTSKINKPTTIVTIDAYEPAYDKAQLIFVPGDKDLHFTTDTNDRQAINSQTYTGAFCKELIVHGGMKVNAGDKLFDILKKLEGQWVTCDKIKPDPDHAPKAQDAKWYITALSAMKPSA